MDKIEKLAVDMDLRLFELWQEIPPQEEWTLEVFAAFLRAAYGRGYIDALEETKQGEYAKLCRDNGYRIP